MNETCYEECAISIERKIKFIKCILDRLDIDRNSFEIEQAIKQELVYIIINDKFTDMYPRYYNPVKIQEILYEQVRINKSIDDLNILWNSYCKHRELVNSDEYHHYHYYNRLREMKIEA